MILRKAEVSFSIKLAALQTSGRFDTRHQTPETICRTQSKAFPKSDEFFNHPVALPMALSATISTDIAAGVIPSMRETCPRDTGFVFESFSFNSLDNPWTLVKSKSRGIFILSKF
jgi:hypothetical protein